MCGTRAKIRLHEQHSLKSLPQQITNPEEHMPKNPLKMVRAQSPDRQILGSTTKTKANHGQNHTPRGTQPLEIGDGIGTQSQR